MSCYKVEEYLKNFWLKRGNSWLLTGKDHYKEVFLRKALRKFFSNILHDDKLKKRTELLIADFGCGTGILTRELINAIFNINPHIKIKLHCYDINPLFLKKALYTLMNSFEGRLSINIFCSDLTKEKSFIKKYDLIFSSFVVHDIYNYKIFFRNIANASKEGTKLFLLFLNPCFIEVMAKHKRIRRLKHFNKVTDNCGFFREIFLVPVLNDKNKVIWVPYVHRYLEDYIMLLETLKFSTLRITYFKPENLDRTFLGKYPIFSKKSPYYPFIFEIPLSVIIYAAKL